MLYGKEFFEFLPDLGFVFRGNSVQHFPFEMHNAKLVQCRGKSRTYRIFDAAQGIGYNQVDLFHATFLGSLQLLGQYLLCVVNHPTGGALNWKLELNSLKERGVEQIDLIISDALQGIERAVCSAFPQAAHQLCVVHFKRHVLNQVSKKDKAILKQKLEELFPIQEKGFTPFKAFENLCTFAARWGKHYRSLSSLAAPRNIPNFTYLRFPESVRGMIYSTNWVERLNRSYKRTLRLRGALPSAEVVIFLLGSVAKEMTETTYARRLPYFQDWKIK